MPQGKKLCQISGSSLVISFCEILVPQDLTIFDNSVLFYFLATTCGRNLPCSGIEPMPSALGARNYNHGITREVPSLLFINRIFFKCSFVHSFYLFVVKMLICIHSVQFSSIAQSCPTLCNPMDCSTPGLPVSSPTPGVYSNSHPLSQ